MERRYYNASALESVLSSYEAHYHLSSAEFYAAHQAENDDVLGRVPRHHRHLWASYYRDARRLNGDDTAEPPQPTTSA